MQIVSKSSAAVPGVPDVEVIALHKSHRALIKFASEDDDDFRTAVGQLQLMVRDASAAIEARWGQHRRRGMSYHLPVVVDSADEHSELDTVKRLADLPKLPYRSAGTHFVGRTRALDWVRDQFSEEQVLLLCGLGGIGKTRIAVEYIYANHTDYDIVFWANADTRDTIRSSFCDMARQLLRHHAGPTPTQAQQERAARELGFTEVVDGQGKIVGDASNAALVVDAVKEWLSTGSSGRWLLVCDNHDNPVAFDISEYLPNQVHGKVLITTRRQDLKELGVGYDVGGLDVEDGVRLLLDKSGKKEQGMNTQLCSFNN